MHDFPVIRKKHAQNNVYHENILQSVFKQFRSYHFSLCIVLSVVNYVNKLNPFTMAILFSQMSTRSTICAICLNIHCNFFFAQFPPWYDIFALTWILQFFHN